MLGAALLDPGAGAAQSNSGTFPSTAEVGGQVFREGLKPGDRFPTDIEAYDETGAGVDLGPLLKSRRTLLSFFSVVSPRSLDEVERIQRFVDPGRQEMQLVFLNADMAGVELLGGPTRAIPETARTLRLIRQEWKIRYPLLAARNDVFDPVGLSNRLGLRGLPTTYLIDADGKIEQIFIGPQQWATGGATNQGGRMEGCPMMQRSAHVAAGLQEIQQEMAAMRSMLQHMRERIGPEPSR